MMTIDRPSIQISFITTVTFMDLIAFLQTTYIVFLHTIILMCFSTYHHLNTI